MSVLRLGDVDQLAVINLLARFGLRLSFVEAGVTIPGSYWGADEAGLIAGALYARLDTPIHSILHEAAHWITCSEQRRASLHTDAADNQEEENASCYLQILLAAHIPKFGLVRAWRDMDLWGYSFRLGSARAWFEQDAAGEQQWLLERGILMSNGLLSFTVRKEPGKSPRLNPNLACNGVFL